MKKMNTVKKLRPNYSIFGGIGVLIFFFVLVGLLTPVILPPVIVEGAPSAWESNIEWTYPGESSSNWDNNEWDIIEGTASGYQIKESVETAFGSYTPQQLSYVPRRTEVELEPYLANVDLQDVSIPTEIRQQLQKTGFALVDEGYEDIYEIYKSGNPNFITTDLCLHAYHVLYDISLRVLEGTHFVSDFGIMLHALRSHQMDLKNTTTEPKVHEAITKNIAYLSVMLYLLDSTTYPIPSEVKHLVEPEITNIESGTMANSTIFGYYEDFSQYKIRGHYTRNELLGKYFKAMMYAGRMGFLLQSPLGEIEMGINHTRMALLLVASFNTTIGEESVWDYWDRIYQPTIFYVGSSDDLTALEYYQIWKSFGSPQGAQLADDTLIVRVIEEVKTYRKPKINSMFVHESVDYETVTQGFRLMGQRFIPDSYIFLQLVHTNVYMRFFPNSLDIFSVFGSSRAAYYLQNENKTYSDYDRQIQLLRKQFGNLTDNDWGQNLYWLWLYALFPLLKPPTEGYPSFMLSEAWLDKVLMTTLGSWAELRHDTILYAKQSYTSSRGFFQPPVRLGYVEPYPEVYARLSSLVKFMKEGLASRGLLMRTLRERLDPLSEVFDRLTTISIKELENKSLNNSDINFISGAGEQIANLANFDDPVFKTWVSGADKKMAIIADVHTDPNSRKVLEVATGNPFVIYAIVQDAAGNLRLTRGGTFSYYDFLQPMSNRLTDEEWQTMLKHNPPTLPQWIQNSIPIVDLVPSWLYPWHIDGPEFLGVGVHLLFHYVYVRFFEYAS
ncbi:MAG: DUF3160 domain-containing protein [Candidatus Hodarchaeota archaeon]